MEEVLHGRVIGQEEAVSAISRAIRRARVGLKNPNRPIASFIFAGPTGVGKSELAKTLASYYFGSEEAMVRARAKRAAPAAAPAPARRRVAARQLPLAAGRLVYLSRTVRRTASSPFLLPGGGPESSAAPAGGARDLTPTPPTLPNPRTSPPPRCAWT
jgi:hypothetical protein